MLLSLGYQDFRPLREDNRIYVDKTEQIARVLDINKYLFLARPRRFGKSLTVSTLAELHSGDRALFEGLWAYDHWDFEAKHSSVIWLQFASSHFQGLGLDRALHGMLDKNAKRLGVTFEAEAEADPGKKFTDLIEAAAAVSPSGKTVLLVDEYDKPIVAYLGNGGDEDLPQAQAHRDQLKKFYSVLKDADRYLGLVFITGISALTKVSMFSDLNNVTNLTLEEPAADLVGLTEAEFVSTYRTRLDASGVDIEELRRWYNGYRFSSAPTRVYNPWSVLSFFTSNRFRSYWYETGTPTWLAERLVDSGQVDLTGAKVFAERLVGFDLDRIDEVSLLYQTGYLTIVDYDDRRARYTLDYPNLEVRQAFESGLLYVAQKPASPEARIRALNLIDALNAGDVPQAIAIIDATVAGVPCQLWQKQTESVYHLIVHVLFRSMGIWVKSEVSSARGRADAVVELDERVYVFEFKIDASAEEALQQIEERGYALPYVGGEREVVAVGVSFDTAGRRVGEFEERVLG